MKKPKSDIFAPGFSNFFDPWKLVVARDEGFLGSDAPTVATWAEGTLNVEHIDAGELLDTKRKLRRTAKASPLCCLLD